MKLCWSKECCIVFTYLANFWWWLFTPLTDTVNLSCNFANSYSRAKAEPRSKQKTMNEGARGEGSEKNRLQSTPWDFWTAFAFWTQGAAVLTGRQNFNPSADVRFPVDTNFKRVPSVEMRLTWFMFAQKNIQRQYLKRQEKVLQF